MEGVQHYEQHVKSVAIHVILTLLTIKEILSIDCFTSVTAHKRKIN